MTWLNRRYGWRRELATGAIFVSLALFVTVMIFVLIPAIVQVSDRIAAQLPGWLNGAEDTSRTMELEGGVAFGAALAGGAIGGGGGGMGAFMALPVAAWITSFIKEFSHTYPLTYRSRYDEGAEAIDP